MEREEFNSCSCNFESEDDFDNEQFHLKDCQQSGNKDTQMRLKLSEKRRISECHRKKRKIKKRLKQNDKKESLRRRIKKMIIGRFSAFYCQCSVAEARTNPSPWSS